MTNQLNIDKKWLNNKLDSLCHGNQEASREDIMQLCGILIDIIEEIDNIKKRTDN